MPPGEENNAEFGENVDVGDIEVVFQGRNRDQATELGLCQIATEKAHICMRCAWW